MKKVIMIIAVAAILVGCKGNDIYSTNTIYEGTCEIYKNK